MSLWPTIELLVQAGGGGGSGGGSGGGELIVLLIRFTIAYPHLGIPLIVLICVGLYYEKQAESNHRFTRTVRRGRKLQEEDLRDDGLAKIQQRDPQFTLEIFLQRVRSAFLATQQAWSDQNLQSCRAFISDGVHERFDLYIRMQQRRSETGAGTLSPRIVSTVETNHP